MKPTATTHDLAHRASDLRVTRARALRGGNLWSTSPIIVAELRLGALAGTARHDVAEALARLGASLPEALRPGTNPPVVDRTRSHPDAAWWGELVVRTTLALQRRAGAPDRDGRLVLSEPDADRWTVAFGYDEEELGLEAVRQAARVVRDVLRGDDPEIADTVADLTQLYRESQPDPSTRIIVAAARRRGISVRRNLDDASVQLGLGITQRRVARAETERTSVLAARLASAQSRVRRVIEGVGVPVPRGDRARSLDEAIEIAEDIGYPVQLHREGERAGRESAIGDESALRAQWASAGRAGGMVVERAVEGAAYHALVVGGRVVAVVECASGEARDVDRDHLAAMHPDVRAVCELATGAVGLDIAGVELTTTNLAAPLRETGGVVTAVHSSPDLSLFEGAASGVGDAIVDLLYPDGAPTTIPVVAITGTNGKTTTTRLIAHLFRQTGRTVGFTTTDGVYLQEQLLLRGDLTGPFAANVILSHREVEVAVLETARGGILKSGLGFEQCDVAVVLNVTADHLGLRGIDTVEQLAEVKAVIPKAVKAGGHAVLNADDPLVYAMRDRTPGDFALFSTVPAGESAAVEEQLARGGVVARVEEVAGVERLVIRRGAERVDLGAATEIPLTFGGHARFQIQNVLAASTAAFTGGVSADDIRRGLATFIPSTAATPGRLNMIETTRGRVLLDYAHNPAAIAGLFDFVRAMPANRRMALLSAPGDRRDEDLREIGRLAKGLDLVIMKEHDVYRRGRAPGAIAEIMADGLRATGFPPERVLTFVEEHDAVAHVMSVMAPGDVVIIVADDTEAVTKQLAPILSS